MRTRTRRILCAGCILLIAYTPLMGQEKVSIPGGPQPQQKQPERSSGISGYRKNHIMWVIPNYRTDEDGTEITVALTPQQKFKLAVDDSLDPTAFLVAGVFAGLSMAQNQYRSFGHGAEGFGKYYGGAFADQAIGNTMTEALLPIALHQDPRYFIKGQGGFFKRVAYATSREVVTRSDRGQAEFNTSELLGNAIAAGISNVYYPAADRSLGNTFGKWGEQIGIDAGFNIMKEFWPDVRRKFFGH
ncbi:MAG TPA: hypothetical protein VMU05_21075 [Dongiaceae bacterium]|nr:hypothetical protein [Dongiaceae bacterium]